MRTVDFAPLYRNAIGFDRLFDLMEAGATKNSSNGYPPYNIEQQDENKYRITMAVAGFSDEQLDITQKENMLIVRGERKAEEEKKYVHDAEMVLLKDVASLPLSAYRMLVGYNKNVKGFRLNNTLNIYPTNTYSNIWIEK